jgi:hypothetical protein
MAHGVHPEVTAAASALFVSGAPHLPQKSDVGGFSALHLAQGLVSALPHFAQKLLADPMFCKDMIDGVEAWFALKKTDENVQRNLANLVQFHPNGLSPYLPGVPAVGGN